MFAHRQRARKSKCWYLRTRPYAVCVNLFTRKRHIDMPEAALIHQPDQLLAFVHRIGSYGTRKTRKIIAYQLVDACMPALRLGVSSFQQFRIELDSKRRHWSITVNCPSGSIGPIGAFGVKPLSL